MSQSWYQLLSICYDGFLCRKFAGAGVSVSTMAFMEILCFLFMKNREQQVSMCSTHCLQQRGRRGAHVMAPRLTIAPNRSQQLQFALLLGGERHERDW